MAVPVALIAFIMQVAAWRQHTTADFQELWLAGLGHNYIADAPEELLQTIAAQLSIHKQL